MSSSRSWPAGARFFKRLPCSAVIVAEDLGVFEKDAVIEHALKLFAAGEVVLAAILLGAAGGRVVQEMAKSTPLTCLRSSLTSVLLPEPDGAEMMKRMPATLSFDVLPSCCRKSIRLGLSQFASPIGTAKPYSSS